MYELTETERHWLAAQADGERTIVVPGSLELRLRQMDLITARYDKSFVLSGLGLGLALRLKYRFKLSIGYGAGRNQLRPGLPLPPQNVP